MLAYPVRVLELLARALLFGSALALAGCNGGDGSGADTRFAFQSAALSLDESDAPARVTVVLTSARPVLPVDVSVEVVDLGTGTATSGSDYAFAPQTVTFAAGSADGATAIALLDPLDDAFVEARGETVVLGLRAAHSGVLDATPWLRITLADADRAQVGFATAAGSSSEGSAGPVALELECGAGVTLQVDVSVRVSDLGTGTAELLTDYALFPEQTILFPAGSADGAVQTASLGLLQDTTAEVAETIELGLSRPSVACTLGAVRAHVLSIADDDLAVEATFQASEGVTGTENGLAYDARIELGTDAVGGGPSAGTLVRVANLGGQPMGLDPPHLTGNHPRDFAIEVESSSFATPLASGPARAFLPAARALAPLVVLPRASGPGVVLRVEAAELARMAERSAVVLQDVVLPELGPVTLELSRRPLPIAPDAKLVIDGKEVAGGPRTLLGDLQLWSGTVTGRAGSRVFLAFERERVQGFVHLSEPVAGPVHVFAEGPGLVRFVGESELQALGARLPGAFCANERLRPAPARSALVPDDPGASSTIGLTMADCRLALETDFQLWQKLDSSSVRLASYVIGQIAAVSEQFATDVQTTLSIAYLGIHTSADDGWIAQETEGADAVTLLYEFEAAWTLGSWPVEADLAHFLSGAELGGGVGYIGVLCWKEYAFAVSAELDGNVDWPLWNGQAARFLWDFYVVAHELGHNFGSEHTHSYCPPLDECPPSQYWENCQDETRCERGTIMSYCHIGCGGLANLDPDFHPVTANIMRLLVNGCLVRAALSPGDFVQYRLRFNPLTATGPRSAALSFMHDALNERRPFRVQLSGTAD